MTSSQARLRITPLFLLLTVLFVTTLLTSNIMAVKLMGIAGQVLFAAIIIFPISYILGDVLTEVYGYRHARLVIWLGFLCNLVMVLAFWAGGMLPPAPVWKGQDAYETILGSTPRILAASFAAYLVGEFSNSLILSRMKLLTAGRWLWARTIGSTIVGEGLDSLVFGTLALGGIVPRDVLLHIVLVQWLAKMAYEVLATPVTYAVVAYLKRKEGVDAYDRDISLNPLALFR
ncbi:MAG: queuosine precursor transporter [Chloroflexi bacterium]|nr:queuosine precursor transporter [Chloroflexota bacterium]